MFQGGVPGPSSPGSPSSAVHRDNQQSDDNASKKFAARGVSPKRRAKRSLKGKDPLIGPPPAPKRVKTAKPVPQEASIASIGSAAPKEDIDRKPSAEEKLKWRKWSDLEDYLAGLPVQSGNLRKSFLTFDSSLVTKFTGRQGPDEGSFNDYVKAGCLWEPIERFLVVIKQLEKGRTDPLTELNWTELADAWVELHRCDKIVANTQLRLLQRGLSNDSPLRVEVENKQIQPVEDAEKLHYLFIMLACKIKKAKLTTVSLIDLLIKMKETVSKLESSVLGLPILVSGIAYDKCEKMFGESWNLIINRLNDRGNYENEWPYIISEQVWNVAKSFVVIWTPNDFCELGEEYNVGEEDLLNSEYQYFSLLYAFGNESPLTENEKEQLALLIDTGLLDKQAKLQFKLTNENHTQSKTIDVDWRDWLLEFQPGKHSLIEGMDLPLDYKSIREEVAEKDAGPGPGAGAGPGADTDVVVMPKRKRPGSQESPTVLSDVVKSKLPSKKRKKAPVIKKEREVAGSRVIKSEKGGEQEHKWQVELEGLKTALESKEQEAESLSIQSESFRLAFKDKLEEVNSVSREKNRAEAALRVKEEEIDFLERQLETVRRELGEKNAEMDNLTREKRRIEMDLLSKKTEVIDFGREKVLAQRQLLSTEEELATLRAEKEGFSSELSGKNLEIASLRRENERLRTDINTRKKANDELQRKSADLISQIKSKERECQSLEGELGTLHTQMAEKTGQITELEGRCKSYEQQREVSNRYSNQLERELRETKEELGKLSEELTSQGRELVEVKRSNIALVTENTHLKEVETAFDDLKLNFNKAEVTLNENQIEMAKAVQAISEFEMMLKEQTGKILSFENELKEKDSQCVSLQRTIQDVEVQLDLEKNKRLKLEASLKETPNSLEAQIKKLQEDRDALIKEIENKNEDYQAVKRGVDMLAAGNSIGDADAFARQQKELEAVEAERDRQKKAVERNLSEIAAMHSEIESLKEKRDQLQIALGSTEKEKSEVEEALTELTKQSNAAEVERVSLSGKVAKLEENVENLKQRNAKSEAENVSHLQEISQLLSSQKSLEDREADLVKKITSLQGELDQLKEEEGNFSQVIQSLTGGEGEPLLSLLSETALPLPPVGSAAPLAPPVQTSPGISTAGPPQPITLPWSGSLFSTEAASASASGSGTGSFPIPAGGRALGSHSPSPSVPHGSPFLSTSTIGGEQVQMSASPGSQSGSLLQSRQKENIEMLKKIYELERSPLIEEVSSLRASISRLNVTLQAVQQSGVVSSETKTVIANKQQELGKKELEIKALERRLAVDTENIRETESINKLNQQYGTLFQKLQKLQE